jgi:spermidine/putrescine transport system permease protein
MTSSAIWRAMMGFYIGLFFLFLFGPLIVMGLSAFNTSQYPQAYPIEGLTLKWFGVLFADRGLMEGLGNSLLIGFFVVLLSVPLGLAGALVMTQMYARARSLYYLVVVSPVLTPGVILGISTVIFWSDVADWTGVPGVYNGIFLSTLGQSTYISAYCMLIFLSRLQRYDRTQEEAALDLGASPTQVFAHILIPYLWPAIISAVVIAFLSSFENYNTTTFAILADKTMTTVLAGRMRQGTTPAISALAVVIIAVSIAGAIAFELARRAEGNRETARKEAADAAERAELNAGFAVAALR